MVDAVLAGLILPGVQNHSLRALVVAARRAGFTADCIRYRGFADVDTVAGVVATRQPRLFGLSMQTTETALASATLIEVLRRRGYRGLIVAGGHFATLNAEGLLRDVPGLDAVVRFAGEQALVTLLGAGLTADVAGVPGLVARGAEGATRWGAPPTLDVLPRAFVDGDDAQGEQPVHLGFPAADLVLSRGCEAHCGYCCVAGASDLAEQVGPRYQRRDVDAIAAEMASLHHERGVRVFNFMDDNLLPLDDVGALAWAEALGAALRRRRVGRIAFSLQLRADVCSGPVVRALAELGLVRAYLGIDGYSGRQLVALGRDAPADAGCQALDNLAAAGVFSVCNALVMGPTFTFEAVRGEIEALARVRHAPVHLLPIDVRAGSAYFERVRRRGLLEGGLLCRRYRFADARMALLAEGLLGFPTRLEEYSVPVAAYDVGYNLGIARRLLPDADLAGAVAVYRSVTERWNADQLRLLRAVLAAAATGERATVRELVDREAPRVRTLDDELRAALAGALAAVERTASRDRGVPVRAHARGRLLSALALSAALAACESGSATSDAAAQDPGGPKGGPTISLDAGGPISVDAGTCPGGLRAVDTLPTWGCGEAQAEVTFDANGVPGAVHEVDGGVFAQGVLDCLQRLLAGYCFPSYAGTTQTLVSHHFWIA